MKKKDNLANIKNFRIKKAVTQFTKYLKEHHISYETSFERDEPPCILMLFRDCYYCPGEITEGTLTFYPEGFEASIFYSESGSKWCRESENKNDLYRLLNYINSEVWISVTDGNSDIHYDSKPLFNPRFFVTEDDSNDITATMFVSYKHYEQDELKTSDYITAALPDVLNDLSSSIFMLLLGKITVEEAIDGVNKAICNG